MKIKILNTDAVSFKSADFFSGVYTVSGTEVTFVITQCDKAGMIYVGQNEFVASKGKEVTLFFARMSKEQALFALQEKAEIEEIIVTKVTTSTWIAKDAYGRNVVCETEEEAQNAHKKFGEPDRVDHIVYSIVKEEK